MMLDFLEAFNKAADDEWQRDAVLQHALDAALSTGGDASGAQARAAQRLQALPPSASSHSFMALMCLPGAGDSNAV